MSKLIAVDDVRSLIKAGDTVFVQGGSGEPTEILEALQRATPSIGNVNYVGVFPPGINHWDPASFSAGSTMSAFFAIPEMAPSIAAGSTRLLPLHYSGITAYLEKALTIDVALIQVAPPDQDGLCSLGVSVDFVSSAWSRAKIVIAEVNRSMPGPPDSPGIPIDKIDYIVEVDHPLAAAAGVEVEDEVSRQLGQTVASLVEDGDTIQMGMGRIPTAVLVALATKNDLGFHSGLLTEPVLDLIESGNINGINKPIDIGKAVTGIAFGSQSFYEALGHNSHVAFRPTSYTHDASVIHNLRDFVAINSALEVDLDGQINAEFVGNRQVSGIGGLGDFMQGARLAANGRSIVALPSRTANGHSRIVGQVARVTCARTDADFIVTEFGIASLRNRSARERSEALIAIAAPEFRDQLIKSAL